MFRAVKLEDAEWIEKLENAFVSYFGRDRVGFVQSNNSYDDGAHSNPYLVVYFPNVDIKRYHHGQYTEKHHEIKDLFMFIELDARSKNLQPYLKGLRTTYSVRELASGYSHSHLRSTYRGDCHTLHDFCTGTGSIRNTLSELSTNRLDRVDEDLLTMLAFQLDMLVPVESVDGVPYNSLTNIGNRSRSSVINGFTISPRIPNEAVDVNIKSFIKYLATKNYFKFVKSNGFVYPFKDVLSLERELSVLFVEWLLDSGVGEELANEIIDRNFVACKYDGCGFVTLGDASDSLGSDGVPEGTPIIELNNRTFNLTIESTPIREDSLKMLKPSIIATMLSYIYKTINVYGE